MKREGFGTFVIVMVGLLALALMTPSQANERSTTKAEKQCRFQAMQNGKWTKDEVERTIRCAAERWPVDLDTAFYVADRESNFLYHARNTSSGACGVYQHMPQYWGGRVRNFLQATGARYHIRYPSCFNARANVLVSIRMAHQGGWGPWSL